MPKTKRKPPKPPRRLWGLWNENTAEWCCIFCVSAAEAKRYSSGVWRVAPLDTAELIALRARVKELEAEVAAIRSTITEAGELYRNDQAANARFLRETRPGSKTKKARG